MRALTPDRRATSPINTAYHPSCRSRRGPRRASPPRSRTRIRRPGRATAARVAIACARTRGSGSVVAARRIGMIDLTERDQRPAEAQLRLTLAAPELRRQHRGQFGFLTVGYEHDRRPPGAARHLVVGVGQQRPGDRRPRPPVPDLGQRVQRLASCLRRSERTSCERAGTVIDGGWRVSAQVSMSRTEKSGSIAQRSMSLSTNRGSGVVPTASAARSRTDGSPLASPRSARVVSVSDWSSGPPPRRSVALVTVSGSTGARCVRPIR